MISSVIILPNVTLEFSDHNVKCDTGLYGTVSGFIIRLQIFWELNVRETQGPEIYLEFLEFYHLMYPRLLIEFGELVFFTNSNFMRNQVKRLGLFQNFSVMHGHKRF